MMGPTSNVGGGRARRGRAAFRSPHYLVAADHQPRVRRASDVTSVIVGALLVGWAIRAHGQGADQESSTATLMTLPSWITSALHLVSTAVLVYTVGLLVVLASSRRAGALRDVLAAGVLAALG
ncbi:MAG TPA: hypothetical protein VGN19_07460, partial [Pedococcus sp.]|nr:hypothetical protein [Pedococcus sp.]